MIRRLRNALARARTPELLPAEVILEGEPEAPAPTTAPVAARLQPPPIPPDARLAADTHRKLTDQERAWQELTNGRHPRLATRRLSRPAAAEAAARHL